MQKRYFVGLQNKLNLEEDSIIDNLPKSGEINETFEMSDDIDLDDLENFVDNYLCCHRSSPFIYIFEEVNNRYKIIDEINIYENYSEKDFGYDADEYPYDLYEEIIDTMAGFINEYVTYDAAYLKMENEIGSGNIEQLLDFYGYFLTYYHVEDTDKTQRIFADLFELMKDNNYQWLLNRVDSMARNNEF